jgi:chorismate lyase/3-hydroxybenzoate synthase
VAPTRLLRLDPPLVPHWVADALGADAREGLEVEKDGVVVQTRGTDDLLFVRASLPRAATLEDLAFRNGVARCYATAADILGSRDLQPVRIWNYVPTIRRPSEDGFSRYEVFNAGRQQGYRECYGEDASLGRVTSSAVGHRGADLVVHVLAGRERAAPVENPRQRPAYRYSARYGPEPPCFCRASRVAGSLGSFGAPALGLVAGTASILGEDSVHAGDLSAQLEETFRNLAAICGEVAGVPLGENPDASGRAAALARYGELRVYLVRETDAEPAAAAVRAAFPGLERFDLVAADLCRPELLVEVEGVLHCGA